MTFNIAASWILPQGANSHQHTGLTLYSFIQAKATRTSPVLRGK